MIYFTIWYLTGIVAFILAVKVVDKEPFTIGAAVWSLLIGISGPICLFFVIIALLCENWNKKLW